MFPITLHWFDPDDGTQGMARVSTSPCVLGRGSDVDLVLPFGFVSTRHARLDFVDGGWWVEDLSSTNGTAVDGERIERQCFYDGAVLGFGRLRVRVDFGGSPGEGAVDEAATHDATVAFDRLAAQLPTAAAQSELEKMRLLLDLQQDFEREFSARATLLAVLRAVLAVSGAERACILLREGETLRFEAGWHGEFGELFEGGFRGSRTIADRALDGGQAVFGIDGVDQPALDLASESIHELDLRAVAALPLREDATEQVRGVLYLDSTRRIHRLSGLDDQLLKRLAGEAEAVLTRLDLRVANEARRRQERELEFARHTQEQLLPRELPVLRGFSMSAVCVPSREVGGDFYDLTPLGEDRLLLVVADVSGKGVAASLLAASTQAAVFTAMRTSDDPGTALAQVNDFVEARFEEGRFVTAFVAVLEVDGTLTWMSAGHNPALVWRARAREIERLGLCGVALGAVPSEFFGHRYTVNVTRLEKGDGLLVYSDGVTEAEDLAHGQFGEERLDAILMASAESGAEVLRDAVIESVRGFVGEAEPSDDLTVMVVERETVNSASRA